MKIVQSSLMFTTSRVFEHKEHMEKQVEAWVDPTPSGSPGSNPKIENTLPEPSAVEKTTALSEGEYLDPKLALIKQVLEALTGKKINLASIDEYQTNAPAANPASSPAQENSADAAERLGWGLRILETHTVTESEKTTILTNGSLTTADGRTFSFDLNLQMEREFQEEERFELLAGDALTDPLVINLNGSSAELSNTKFAFDLNADGLKEEIPFTESGSGFLVLDKNRDGSVNDGRELFGPVTGNGFGELGGLDLDHNGWIDGNDPGFHDLYIWSGQSPESATLTKLSETGIGALSITSGKTDFSLKNSANVLLGRIRSTGIYIREDGKAGYVQQVDLAV